VLALLHGNVREAMGWNPLVFAGIVLLILMNVYAATVLAGKLPRVRFSLNEMDGRFIRAAAAILFAMNWAWVIHRIG